MPRSKHVVSLLTTPPPPPPPFFSGDCAIPLLHKQRLDHPLRQLALPLNLTKRVPPLASVAVSPLDSMALARAVSCEGNGRLQLQEKEVREGRQEVGDDEEGLQRAHLYSSCPSLLPRHSCLTQNKNADQEQQFLRRAFPFLHFPLRPPVPFPLLLHPHFPTGPSLTKTRSPPSSCPPTPTFWISNLSCPMNSPCISPSPISFPLVAFAGHRRGHVTTTSFPLLPSPLAVETMSELAWCDWGGW